MVIIGLKLIELRPIKDLPHFHDLIKMMRYLKVLPTHFHILNIHESINSVLIYDHQVKKNLDSIGKKI